MFIFETSTKQEVNNNHLKNEQVPKQVLVPSINSINNTNNTKQSKGVSHTPRFSPPSLEDIKVFFLENNSNHLEAEKYNNHFQSNGWLVGGKTKMKDWKAAARNWILRAKSYAEKSNPPMQRLNANQNTNYDEPL